MSLSPEGEEERCPVCLWMVYPNSECDCFITCVLCSTRVLREETEFLIDLGGSICHGCLDGP